jgi:hypothetical protein
MRQHDQQRFAKLVSEFIDGCGIEPPLYSKASKEPGAETGRSGRSPPRKDSCPTGTFSRRLDFSQPVWPQVLVCSNATAVAGGSYVTICRLLHERRAWR